jgi:hypothetical protein
MSEKGYANRDNIQWILWPAAIATALHVGGKRTAELSGLKQSCERVQ